MSRLCLLLCRVDEGQPDVLTQLQRFDLPVADAEQLTPGTAVDELETQTLAVGQQVMRGLLEQRWQEVDEQLVAAHRRRFPPSDAPR